jgi:hypothetical protein
MGTRSGGAKKVWVSHLKLPLVKNNSTLCWLGSTLDEILQSMKAMKSAEKFDKAWNADKNATEIEKMRRKLDQTVDSFTVSSILQQKSMI